MDVGNLWLIHMDWVPGCAILNNIKQTNHNKSLTNQILQGSQIKKTSSPFWPSNDSNKQTRVIILPTQHKALFRGKPSNLRIDVHCLIPQHCTQSFNDAWQTYTTQIQPMEPENDGFSNGKLFFKGWFSGESCWTSGVYPPHKEALKLNLRRHDGMTGCLGS